MRTTVIATSRRWLEALGLFGPVFWLWRVLREWSPALERRNRQLREAAPDGSLPIPPNELIFAVMASRDVQVFLDTGARSQAAIARIFREAGLEPSRAGAILDFGCGCGRVLRHWRGVVPDGVVHGTDYNPDAVAWVAANLPHVTAGRNALEPPFRYGPATFDAVYALSVFTHLTVELEAAWLAELERVTKPGGVVLLTTQGDQYRPKLSPAELAAYDRGDVVVRQASLAGSNWCATFHPEPYVRRVFGRAFDLVRYETGGAPGIVGQDLVLLRRRAEPS